MFGRVEINASGSLNELFATNEKRCYQKVSWPLILPSHGTQDERLCAPVASQSCPSPLRMTFGVQTYRGGKNKTTSRALGDRRGCIQSEQVEQAVVAITRHRDPTPR